MRPNYNVQAQVVKIDTDIPQNDEKFFVDTNIWLWTLYEPLSWKPLMKTESKKTGVSGYQIKKYPRFFYGASSRQANFFYCGTLMPEIAHSIERWEKELFSNSRQPPEIIELKDFRHNYPEQRIQVVEKIQEIWNLITEIAFCIDFTIDEAFTHAALTQSETIQVDGYDLFIVKAMKKGNIDKIITDDGDFLTVPGITVFTANDWAIKVAEQQGKLLYR
ncbi:MAG: hypothetical protein KME46_21860 [Brasilonema angustatum HA4187-MV1]|jgi:predicted nucleic acid-binding protein|nr:hypothetical protein [Brasilonema angustatum HA4187-MV1]